MALVVDGMPAPVSEALMALRWVPLLTVQPMLAIWPTHGDLKVARALVDTGGRYRLTWADVDGARASRSARCNPVPRLADVHAALGHVLHHRSDMDGYPTGRRERAA